MFARKLKALGYHHPESFSLKDAQEVKNLVVWLEDRKIRFYEIERREPLRNTESSSWLSALKKYLSDIKCPVEDVHNQPAVINWLISHAVKLEYSANNERYNEEVECTKKLTLERDLWIHSINSDDPELKNGIESLQKLLEIPSHPDHVIVLQAIAKIIESRLSEQAIHAATQKTTSNTEYIKLDSISLGFDTHDEIVNEAAKILRLLQISNLRELQTRINQSIVAMQKLSANPKTDQSLGKVGI